MTKAAAQSPEKASFKSPELRAAIELMNRELMFAVQVRMKAVPAEGEKWSFWRTWERLIKGKDAAYERARQLRIEHPEEEFRVIRENEAEAYENGLRTGLRLFEGDNGPMQQTLSM